MSAPTTDIPRVESKKGRDSKTRSKNTQCNGRGGGENNPAEPRTGHGRCHFEGRGKKTTESIKISPWHDSGYGGGGAAVDWPARHGRHATLPWPREQSDAHPVPIPSPDHFARCWNIRPGWCAWKIGPAQPHLVLDRSPRWARPSARKPQSYSVNEEEIAAPKCRLLPSGPWGKEGRPPSAHMVSQTTFAPSEPLANETPAQ